MDYTSLHKSLGAIVAGDSTKFRVWAPANASLSLELDERVWPMQAVADGFYEVCIPQAATGSTYCYRLANGNVRPDPASRFQPHGVHGRSAVVDPHSYRWQDAHWRGIDKSDLVIYELHLGTFTQAGTFSSAVPRLHELKELGVTAIELMPLAESAGRWNWGYDGVGFFAPSHNYGPPDELRRLVDAAHGHGLAVILDVVYNHFGPEGNYFRDFAPYISAKHQTAWGDAPNFDADDPQVARLVRNYFLANLCYWIDEFHLDGLRIDAIHCMADDSQLHIATELSMAFAAMRQQTDRQLHLIAESNIYDGELLGPLSQGGHGYDAQWCDDFLHSVFSVFRPHEQMSNRRYAPQDLHATLVRGYTYAGSLTAPRQHLSLEDAPQPAELSSLVFSIQNHDFIGNHPLGRRLHQLSSHDAQRAAAALLLLYPAIPMLFMGEEFASENAFTFFVDYGEQVLREAVERGRRAEYPQHDWSHGASPLNPAAFESSQIGPASAGCLETLTWYQSLLGIRKRWQQAALSSEFLTAFWEPTVSVAHLSYETSVDRHFVVVRLNAGDDATPPLTVAVQGSIALSQNCGVGANNTCTLGHNGVVIGSGVAMLKLPQATVAG